MRILQITQPPVCRREILRYAACREETPQVRELLDSCLAEALPRIAGRACYEVFALRMEGNETDLGVLRVRSDGLAGALQGCSRCVIMAATLGVEIDRLIARYGRLSPARAVMLQAIGAERIEALCEAVGAEIAREEGMGLQRRFSPGYGDLPLEVQREIFRVLDCSRRIGLSLTDSLLMTPSKSVTAFAGLSEQQTHHSPFGCSACTRQDCQYRGGL